MATLFQQELKLIHQQTKKDTAMSNLVKKFSVLVLIIPMVAAMPLVLTGCDNKEKVLDVETPDGELEVERNTDTGEVDIEVENNE